MTAGSSSSSEAGLCGLVALDRLAKAGREAVLLEAGTRLGGRILTVREKFSDGAPLSPGLRAELGAERVGFEDHGVRALLKDLGIATTPYGKRASPMLLDWSGRTYRFDDGRDFPTALLEGLSETERKASPLGILHALTDAGTAPDAGDPRTGIEWLRSRGLTPAGERWVRAFAVDSVRRDAGGGVPPRGAARGEGAQVRSRRRRNRSARREARGAACRRDHEGDDDRFDRPDRARRFRLGRRGPQGGRIERDRVSSAPPAARAAIRFGHAGAARRAPEDSRARARDEARRRGDRSHGLRTPSRSAASPGGSRSRARRELRRADPALGPGRGAIDGAAGVEGHARPRLRRRSSDRRRVRLLEVRHGARRRRARGTGDLRRRRSLRFARLDGRRRPRGRAGGGRGAAGDRTRPPRFSAARRRRCDALAPSDHGCRCDGA